MENYFNYFTEIEEHFCRRRGTISRVSTLDWVLIHTWKDAGIPLDAVLRGIDATFDRWERRPSKTKKINGLAFCSQEVLAAAEDMKEAAVGSGGAESKSPAGLETEEIAKYILQNAKKLKAIQGPDPLCVVVQECEAALVAITEQLNGATQVRLEDLERHLTVLEEKLLAVLTMTASAADLLAIRTDADREIAPYRNKMPAAQVEQVRKHYIQRELFERGKIPRLSLFYM